MADFEQGRYLATIISNSMSVSNEKQTPQVVFVIEILGKYNNAGDEAEDLPGHLRGKKRTIWRSITANTVQWVADDLKKLGFNGSSWDELDPDSPDFQSLADQDVDVICSHRMWQGKTQERWEFDLPGDGGGPKIEKISKKDLRALNATFGKVFAQPGAKPAKTGKVATKASDNGDELDNANEEQGF